MPEFITIEEAARITGFPSQEIQQWAISKKITSKESILSRVHEAQSVKTDVCNVTNCSLAHWFKVVCNCWQ